MTNKLPSPKKIKGSAPTEVHANPTKRFFVDMLTRDIELGDALLDLLDNCVDGVLRETRGKPASATPYKGYRADIKFSPSEFRIEDNCGGIDRHVAETYAFLMGRRADDVRDRDLPTVGMYGIGMKRAIFKLGRDAKVTSCHAGGWFEIAIPPAWFKDNDDWTLKAQGVLRLSNVRGTTIVVSQLHSSIRDQFRRDSDFESQFMGRLSSHYAFIMHKGFEVTVNGKPVVPRPIKFLFAGGAKKGSGRIAPYMYDGAIGNVTVQVTVGFYRPLQTDDEADEEMLAKHSREDAGWTVICNDRVVLYCEKSRMTGWGEADVPNFHAQFNAIAGVAVFTSNHADELPLTTTKRGIDPGSDLYLRVKNRMREGTKLFTNYTYKWKHALEQAKSFERAADTVDLGELRGRVRESEWRAVKKDGEDTRKFVPTLPAPPKASEDVPIRFHRPAAEVRRVGVALLDSDSARPGDIGAAAFDKVLKGIRK